jgi:hypothetical protein
MTQIIKPSRWNSQIHKSLGEVEQIISPNHPIPLPGGLPLKLEEWPSTCRETRK